LSIVRRLRTTRRALWIFIGRCRWITVYEVRRGEEIVSTRRLLLDDQASVGVELLLAGFRARVEEFAWGSGESRLVLSASDLAD